MDEPASMRARRKPKWGTLALVAVLHILAILGLARAFAPDFTAALVEQAGSILTVSITAPEEEPPPPEASPKPDEGAAAQQGKQARPSAVSAPKPVVAVRPTQVPPVSSTGDQTQSGAGAAGQGVGGGGDGVGSGSGQAGNGQGNGLGKLEKIAGDINSAKDYPKKTRDLRIGHSVTILLTVSSEGRVSDCRITAPSPDADADAITCRLASERFRFRPARDARGNPIVGKYAWRQSWYY